MLLKKMEAAVGVAAFDKWMKDVYFPTFRRRSITSRDVADCYSKAFPTVKFDWHAE